MLSEKHLYSNTPHTAVKAIGGIESPWMGGFAPFKESAVRKVS